MMTLRRFNALAEAYGADLRRWPEVERAEGAAILAASSVARQMLRDAQHVDSLLEAARDTEAMTLLHPGEQAAALARLRSGVAARIAPSYHRRGARASAMLQNAMAAYRSGWMVMTVGGGVALVAGIWIGGMRRAAAPVDLITILQSSPLHGLVW